MKKNSPLVHSAARHAQVLDLWGHARGFDIIIPGGFPAELPISEQDTMAVRKNANLDTSLPPEFYLSRIGSVLPMRKLA